MNNWRDPIHPGEILADEIEEIEIEIIELANRIGVSDDYLDRIVEGQQNITADTALRLGKFFGTGPDFWLNLQKAYELDLARSTIGDSLETIKPYRHLTSKIEKIDRTTI